MASSVSLNLRVTTPGAKKGEKRRLTGPEVITPHVGHNESKLYDKLTKCSSVEEQVKVVKTVRTDTVFQKQEQNHLKAGKIGN